MKIQRRLKPKINPAASKRIESTYPFSNRTFITPSCFGYVSWKRVRSVLITLPSSATGCCIKALVSCVNFNKK